MKTTLARWGAIALLAVCLTVQAAAVMAQEVSTMPLAPQAPPTSTSPGHIALLYHRLTGQTPDFEAWAMASDDYANANGFDKDLVRREKAAEVMRAYHLITFEEPVVIEHPVTLSAYSRTRQGFFVQNFRPDTFYAFNFLGRDYAMVPLDLLDFQWLSIADEKELERVRTRIAADNNHAYMYLSVVPTAADKTNPMRVQDKEYWLLSGKVKRIQIYDKRRQNLLWEGVGREEAVQIQKEVLDLYK